LGLGKGGEKTGIDLLQVLAALSIPIVIAVGGFWFTSSQNENRLKVENDRHANDQQVEEKRAANTALESYLDDMSNLMLDEPSRNQIQADNVHKIQRSRTIAILMTLGEDSESKRAVVRFLYESRLIGFKEENGQVNEPTISLIGSWLINARLNGLTLAGANLSYTYMDSAKLHNANLSNADLTEAKLTGADLSSADLTDADLTNTTLTNADLSSTKGITDEELEQMTGYLEGATMPDGSTHD
jgi:uncharacterized protein YjbI with pentapeptide repeats